MDGVRHLPVHRLRRRGSSHLLRPQHLPPHGDHGEGFKSALRHSPMPRAETAVSNGGLWSTGRRLHRAGGGRGRQEAGALQSRETRAQLHDGLAHLQEGEDVSAAWKLLKGYGVIFMPP